MVETQKVDKEGTHLSCSKDEYFHLVENWFEVGFFLVMI
jgi:hypothetical protein